MKISHIKIENFRHIRELELDFTDSLGRVKDLVLLVGPNGCGKTTVLDAMTLCIGPLTHLPVSRHGLEVSRRAVPGQWDESAIVTCTVMFASDELERLLELGHWSGHGPYTPPTQTVEVEWRCAPNTSPRLQHTIRPEECRSLFEGRWIVAMLLQRGLLNWSAFQDVGGLVYFDQQRRGEDRGIPRHLGNLVQGITTGRWDGDDAQFAEPYDVLLAEAMKSKLPSSRPELPDNFTLIQECYNDLCHPRRMLGAMRDDQDVPVVRFADGQNEYDFDGLSSGEQMLVLFIIRMVTDQVHRSIVLVDEMELHLHPFWERELFYALPQIGVGNQFIGTTHSPYLRDVAPRGAVYDLGSLDELEGQGKAQEA